MILADRLRAGRKATQATTAAAISFSGSNYLYASDFTDLVIENKTICFHAYIDSSAPDESVIVGGIFRFYYRIKAGSLHIGFGSVAEMVVHDVPLNELIHIAVTHPFAGGTAFRGKVYINNSLVYDELYEPWLTLQLSYLAFGGFNNWGSINGLSICKISDFRIYNVILTDFSDIIDGRGIVATDSSCVLQYLFSGEPGTSPVTIAPDKGSAPTLTAYGSPIYVEV